MMPLKVEMPPMLEEPMPLLKINAALAQHNQSLMCWKDHLERTMRQMELLAIIGPPPGLTKQLQQELLHLPLKHVVAACWEQSTDSSSPRPSSLGESSRSSHCGNPSFMFETTAQERQTTLIIRNIAGPCTRRMLMDFLDRHGFQGKYDFLYLPMRFDGKGCVPYAFINFVTGNAAVDLQAHLTGCNETSIFGESFAEVEWSQCQGLEANIEKFRNSSLMHHSADDECRPLMFEDGKVAPFPKPTRRIKPDRRIAKN